MKSRLTNKDKQKITERYYSKLEECQNKTLDELKVMIDVKMSQTDKHAVLHHYNRLKSLIKEENGSTSGTSERIEQETVEG